MRLLLFSLLITSSVLAQVDTGNGSNGVCTRATIANGGTFNCTSLDISGAPFTFNNGASAVVIKVQGNVSINTSVSLAGGIGGSDLDVYGAIVPGGSAGPGATPGGGVDGSFTAQDGIDHPLLTSSNGKAGVAGLCGGGGGGGSFAALGTNGTACNGSFGIAGSLYFNNIPSPLVGGLGGGSGGEGLVTVYGAGGGGGGSLIIMAGGNIIINGNISARGGNGGSAANNSGNGGGGGGGGSGGVVAIFSLGQITNNGMIDADGGIGGVAAAGGNGGNGGHGFVELEDIDGNIDGIGSIPSYGNSGGSVSRSQKKISSSISCGMIKPNEDSNSTLMQMLVGFMMAALMSLIGRRLKLLPQTNVKSK